jgi:hypothetical protein
VALVRQLEHVMLAHLCDVDGLGECLRVVAASTNPDDITLAAALDRARFAATLLADAAAPPPDLGELRVVSVMLGDALDADHVVRVARSDFDPRATIHASVLTSGTHPGLVLAARWLAPDGRTILETAQKLAPTRPTATTFTLRDAAPWPAGDYVLDVLADGRRVQRVPFTVH